MEKLIKLVNSPFNPNMEVAGDIVINMHVPYSEQDVTVQINPNIQEYQENNDQPDIQIRQVMVSVPTDETKELHFNLKENNVQKFKINDKEYEIKLLNIGKESLQGQDFPSFEFHVKW